jgi:hypothetical protein
MALASRATGAATAGAEAAGNPHRAGVALDALDRLIG